MGQEKSQLRIGIILSYINMLVGNLIPFLYTPIMLQLLGQSEYGLYKLSSTVTSYLTLISLGIGSAVVRYLIDAKIHDGEEGERKVFGLFMIIFRVIAVITLIAGIWLTLNIQIWYGRSLDADQLFRMRILIFIMVCNTALNFLLSPYISVVNAHEKFIFLQSMNIISTCVGPILNLIMLFLGYASIGMAISTIVLGMLVNILYLIYVRKSMKIRPIYNNISFPLLKNILKFSFWIFVANVVGQLFNATDTAMIGAIPQLATEGVAVYNIGATFNSIMSSLTTGITSVMAPKINNMVLSGKSGKELTNLSIKVGRIQCYIMMLVITGFIVFGKPFIYYYAGKGYEESYWVAILMMIPNMIPLAQTVCLNVVIAQNNHQFRSIVYLVIAIINVIGTWFLMQIMGVIGAALMTGIALIIGHGFAMNWFYKVKSGLDIEHFWIEVGKTYIIPIIICVVFCIVSRYIDFYNIKLFFIGIIVYTVIYSVLLWQFILNEYEKNLFLKPFLKIYKKFQV
ncbi:lipopolysaccharide biosynthesis protein [Intestinibacter bartlettii]|uniref:lipopolysaccharide biosynthesis protein n=1 Tax=Intestinibacter bartlettii TaxID=261299 RepID=UPI001D1293F8|nr:oligosaccharide flippase family protein [Intestinibacter bartlettii]MCC2707600.1 oligosaccharide flippase family protein [Intestinibacter bartlettii]MCC2763050.1 oligosaccharide flippase family protein [Intestinibacter bartlettii]